MAVTWQETVERRLQGGRSELGRWLMQFAVSGSPSAMVSEHTWEPATDVYETPTHLMVKMDVAGLRPSDLRVNLDHDMLVIRGQRSDAFRKRACAYRQMEIMTGYFERVIPIDIPIDAANIQARYEAGFLEIAIPKGQQKAATTLVITIINR